MAGIRRLRLRGSLRLSNRAAAVPEHAAEQGHHAQGRGASSGWQGGGLFRGDGREVRHRLARAPAASPRWRFLRSGLAALLGQGHGEAAVLSGRCVRAARPDHWRRRQFFRQERARADLELRQDAINWDRECQFWRLGSTRRGEAPDEKIAHYLRWRETAHPSNIALLDFYGAWRNGLCSGMGGISIVEIRAALFLTGVPEAEHEERTERLLMVHGMLSEIERERA